MTAFEILLNKFFDIIEQNEPQKYQNVEDPKQKELNQLIRKYVDTSFAHGNNLQYKTMLSEIMSQAAGILQGTSHDVWSRVKFVFQENDLHTIKRNRANAEIINLKMRLDRTF